MPDGYSQMDPEPQRPGSSALWRSPRTAATAGGMADTTGGADVARVRRDRGRPAIQADPAGERLISTGQRVQRQPNGCWYYDGEGDRYHMVRGVMAHRWFYTMLTKQPIPKGWHLHHKCERPGCVNPEHLEPLTPGDHSREHARLAAQRSAA